MNNIKSKRVTLRKIRREEVSEYFQIAYDEEIKKFLPYAYCENFEEAEYFLESMVDNTKTSGELGIVNEDDKLVGVITYERNIKDMYELNFFIGQNFRKKGYALESITALIGRLSKEGELTKYIMACKYGNVASKELIKKLGGKRIQVLNNNEYEIFRI